VAVRASFLVWRPTRPAKSVIFEHPYRIILSGHCHRSAQGGARRQTGGVECRQRRIRIIHQQRDFGAAKDDSVTSFFFHLPHNPFEVVDCLRLENTVKKLVGRAEMIVSALEKSVSVLEMIVATMDMIASCISMIDSGPEMIESGPTMVV